MSEQISTPTDNVSAESPVLGQPAASQVPQYDQETQTLLNQAHIVAQEHIALQEAKRNADVLQAAGQMTTQQRLEFQRQYDARRADIDAARQVLQPKLAAKAAAEQAREQQAFEHELYREIPEWTNANVRELDGPVIYDFLKEQGLDDVAISRLTPKQVSEHYKAARARAQAKMSDAQKQVDAANRRIAKVKEDSSLRPTRKMSTEEARHNALEDRLAKAISEGRVQSETNVRAQPISRPERQVRAGSIEQKAAAFLNDLDGVKSDFYQQHGRQLSKAELRSYAISGSLPRE